MSSRSGTRGRRAAVAGLVAAASTVVSLAVTMLPPTRDLVESIELTTTDWRMRSSVRPQPAESSIVLVLFDSASIGDLPWLSPFPRGRLASLIELVAARGPRTIGLDVFLDRRYPELEQLGGGEARLRSALAAAGNVVLVAQSTADGTGGRRLIPPHRYFGEVAAAIGVADLPTPHEVIRDAVHVARTDAGPVPGMALALYALSRGIDPGALAVDLAAGGRPVPTLPQRAVSGTGSPILTSPIRFIGPPSRPGRADGAFPAYSASTLLQLGDAVPQEWFRDRIVLVGSGFHPEDRFRSPFFAAADSAGAIAGWTYGTEVHATALQNLLAGGYPVPPAAPTRVALVFLVGLLTAGATLAWGARAGGLAAAASSLLLGIAAWYLFDTRSVVVPLTGALLAALLAVTGASGWSAAFEGRRARMVRRAFDRYLSPAIVDLLVADPSLLRLGGERRDVTVLFSDLVGFTTLAEHMDPARLVSLLSEYLDEMAGIVIANGGTLDKYVGDAVMALFGAPLAHPDHAARACRTALQMQERLRGLNERWRHEGWPELRVRIGLHTGRPLVGNIGGDHRFDYTAIGDDVNLAARLEGACGSFGVGVAISENTARATAADFRVRELDLLLVKGRSSQVRVYELLGAAGSPSPLPEGLLSRYSGGLAAYREGRYTIAREEFAAVLAWHPDDGPSRIYLERCERLALPPIGAARTDLPEPVP